MKPVPLDWERAAVVVAHPDDVEYGMASAVAAFTHQGKSVSYVLVTSGEIGIAGISPEVCGPLREEEQRRSGAIVGVNQIEFLGHLDGSVDYGLTLRQDLTTALRSIRPEVVFGLNFELTWGEDQVNHSDHRAVGLATLDSCRDVANRWMFPEAGEPWNGIREVYIAGGNSPASHFVDVSDTIAIGVASLTAHAEYLRGLGGDFEPDRFLRDMAGYGGAAAGCDYAVLFRAFKV
jgi:LmbE family N-acetylglucosaminyl deacetylase